MSTCNKRVCSNIEPDQDSQGKMTRPHNEPEIELHSMSQEQTVQEDKEEEQEGEEAGQFFYFVVYMTLVR